VAIAAAHMTGNSFGVACNKWEEDLLAVKGFGISCCVELIDGLIASKAG